MTVRVITVDYHSPQHSNDLIYLLDHYARDPMGGGKSLNNNVKDELVSKLAALPHAFSVIAYMDKQPVGLINCFEAFSTFAAKPLVNIHDIVVLNNYRNQGICQQMIEYVANMAKQRGCCKLTLEVLSNNKPAKSAYQKQGFRDYELAPKAGQALFWEKKL